MPNNLAIHKYAMETRPEAASYESKRVFIMVIVGDHCQIQCRIDNVWSDHDQRVPGAWERWGHKQTEIESKMEV